jgi:hypothetical protein
MQALFSAQSIPHIILWFCIMAIFGLQAFGTLGDIHLIITRLSDEQRPHE